VERRFLSVREAGQYLNLSESLIYKLVETKQIPHTRIGRKILFDLTKIEKWLQENSIEVVHWPEKLGFK
jgi:excisionase family DNA binding protein